MLAALNADIHNAYLNAPAAEKVWCVCGQELPLGPNLWQ